MTKGIQLLCVVLLAWTCFFVSSSEAGLAPFSTSETAPSESSLITPTVTEKDEETTSSSPPTTTTEEQVEWQEEEPAKPDIVDETLESLVNIRILELQQNLKYALKMRGLINAFK